MLTRVEARIGALTSDVSDISNDISSLTDTVTSLNETITSLNATVSALSASLNTTHQFAQDGMDNSSQIRIQMQNIGADVTVLNGTVNHIGGDVAVLKLDFEATKVDLERKREDDMRILKEIHNAVLQVLAKP
jgi:archaellum component FlaC